MLVEVQSEGREEREFPAYVGEDSLYYFVNYQPQFTGRTPDIAPNRVLAMVKDICLDLSGLRIGMRKSNTLRSLRFPQFPGWKPPFESGATLKFLAKRPLWRPAYPSLTPLGNTYTLIQTSGV